MLTYKYFPGDDLNRKTRVLTYKYFPGDDLNKKDESADILHDTSQVVI